MDQKVNLKTADLTSLVLKRFIWIVSRFRLIRQMFETKKKVLIKSGKPKINV